MTILRFLTVCLLAASLPAFADNVLVGYVVGVADGDTITVLDVDRQQHKIRLSGIDAPERTQPFGDKSKTNLSRLVFNKDVRVEWKKRDRYQRIVGKVMVESPDCRNCGQTLDAGLAQITTGMAWWYRDYAKEQSEEDRGRYEHAEFEAKIRRAGLWNDKNPVPPWEWRKG
jgi:endonuclease YncB( thermonuclease family)